jgi:hypothetical protein
MTKRKRHSPGKQKMQQIAVQSLEAFQQTGLPVEFYEASKEISNRARMAVQMGLQGERTFEKINNFMMEFSKVTKSIVEMPFIQNPSATRPACRASCHWCCHVRVVVLPVEVIRTVNFLNENLSSEEFRDIHTRVIEIDDVTRGMNDEERAKSRIFCPLLVNKMCSVYPVRPMSCHGHYSMDADACQQDYEFPDRQILVPFYALATMVYSSSATGIAQGFDDFGLESYPVELGAALRIGLETPNLIKRWLNGEEIFFEARDYRFR